ncbi:astacin, partial [Teladorsagia circumcincta]
NFQNLIRRGIRMWEESTCLRFRENMAEYVVAHETGHALGFWHTHQRPDRDRHISINWKNVMEEATASFMPFRSMLQAFGIRQVSPRRVPYDYGSLMHYHAVAHAIKGEIQSCCNCKLNAADIYPGVYHHESILKKKQVKQNMNSDY